MKKTAPKLCRMLLAFMAVILMFSIQKTYSHAANDTIVIDFSKINPQTYKGKKLTSADLDRINDFKLTEEEKNVVFLSSMIELYKIFPVDNHFFRIRDSAFHDNIQKCPVTFLVIKGFIQ